MTINITGRGTTVKDSFKERLEKKIAKLDRFFDDSVKTDVKVENESERETVEITIHSNGMVFRAESTTDDRMQSLDEVIDKLFRQITRNKDKLRSQLKKSAFEAPFPEENINEEPIEDDFRIIKSKQFFLKPMYADEAILQMNLIGHDFFMFRDAETFEVGVVYKRKDGNYGLIEPSLD